METAEHREPYDARVCAVKTDASNSRCKREKPGGMLLGRPPDRMAKALRDNSMAEKRGVSEHARLAALQDLRDMAKAGLLEPQSPVMDLTSLVTAC
jgi:hypothetical protein